MRRYRTVTVCLVLLCVLLLTAVIVLCMKFTKETNMLPSETEKPYDRLNEQDQCPNNPKWISRNLSSYYISSEWRNWSESRQDCLQRGADLLIINDKEEQDLFKNRSETDSIWIGLSDSDEEGRWKWVDGSTLTTSFWDKVLHKEPNGKRGENCVGSYSPGWADFPCTRTFKWICEKTLY
nr:CD209 antigen-like protein E [Misgurnus anguillicaudatus]